jgi:glycosyltransferase involved in cell wall biosynthesis
MRLGIMLRAIDEKGGIGVYTRNIVTEMLRIDHQNEYMLYYRNSENIGRYSTYSNAKERLVTAPNKAWWDQVSIPIACHRDQVDVLFHPKFTAPVLAPCPVVMTVHGADWFMPDQAKYYSSLDVRYIRAVMPWYIRKCSAVISVSELTTENFNSVLTVPRSKIRTVYFAPARNFRPITDPDLLDSVKKRYDLPDRFILTLTKLLGDERKNFPKLLEAYARYHRNSATPLPLVVGGKDGCMIRRKYGLSSSPYDADIHFPGWIQQEDLPAVYSMAELYLYPSNLEAFPIPITEAMACGTPIVTSNVNGLAEISGDAAIKVSPHDTREIANAINMVASDSALRVELSNRGRARSSLFSWDKCARDTLRIVEQAAGHQDR